MPKASEIKRGQIVEIDAAPHLVKHVEAKSPSARGAATLYKIRFENLISGQKRETSSKGDEIFAEIDCQRRAVQLSYKDDEFAYFMDVEDYSQHALEQTALVDEMNYLIDGTDGITLLVVEDRAVAIELPQSVNLVITETAPGLKGASASARTKPALLETGFTVQVPEYMEPGERVKVNTTTGKFMSRA